MMAVGALLSIECGIANAGMVIVCSGIVNRGSLWRERMMIGGL